MSDVGGITGSPGTNGTYSGGATGPLTVANALVELRRHPTSTVEIEDSVQNILKSLDALQASAAKITSLSTSDVGKSITVTGAQYQKDGAALALWGAGEGQTVAVTAAKANIAVSTPSYVTSVAVADSRTNIQSNLDALQTLASSGVLQEIVQTGTVGSLTITAAQLSADQDALDKIKNHGYTLAITNASVSDVLGLDSQPALSANSKVRAIAIVDTTDAIASHLDELQRVGLRIKSITQTDPTTALTVTGEQYQQDKVVLGKIISADMLDVIDASATQARALASDTRVITVEVHDTAKNLSRNWSFLQNLTDSMTSVQVTDQENAIRLTSAELATSDALLAKFSDTAEQTYKLVVTNVSASTAETTAGVHNVSAVEVADTSDNIVANWDDLKALDAEDKLSSITVTNPRVAMSMDVSRFQGDEGDATEVLLAKVKGGNYRVAVTGAAASDVADLAGNKRIVAFAVNDSSANVTSSLDSLYGLGARLSAIQQTDTGAAFELTQAELDTRGSVLAKISGGYSANLSNVTAAKALADATNLHVNQVAVSDTGRNILARWTALRTLGSNLASISKSDAGAFSLSASDYQGAVHDGLVAKFGGDATFAVTAATVTQTAAIAGDDVVTQIDIADEGSAVQDNLASLETIADGGKIHSITNHTPTVALALDANDLADAQSVLNLIKGGSYKLALTGVAVSDAKTLLATNHKIATIEISGDSTSIVANLSDLNSLGGKLLSITQTDAPGSTLDMTSAAYEQNAAALAKIEGGFLAVLSGVSAAKAATFATDAQVSSLSVTDSGAHLTGAWGSLAQLGSKLTAVTQSDSSAIRITVGDFAAGQALRAKFASDPTVALLGARVSQVSDLASDTAVESIQVHDSAAALAASLGDLAAQAKVTQLVVEDPDVAMSMTAQAYADSATILGKVKNGEYSVDLSQVSADSALTLASDTHVAAMDVSDTSAEITSHFDALAAAARLDSITLTDQDGTITLSASQILEDGSTLSKIEGSYQLAATDVAMADLSDVESVAEVTAIGIRDTAENVSASFSALLALGGSLSQIHLTDDSPVLSLSESAWTTGASALAKVDGSYQVDVTDAVAGDAQALAADNTVHSVAVADTASNVEGNWDTLISLYDEGNGKLVGLSVTDSNPLTLTTAQQTAGAAMIDALLPEQTIQTAG
jgi:hypothetical protein